MQNFAILYGYELRLQTT